MFNDDRSDFAVPIAGLFMFGVMSLLFALLMLNTKYDLADADSATMAVSVLSVIGILGIIDGAIALKKAYLVEGFSFITYSVFALCCSGLVLSTGNNLMLGIVALVVMLFLAFMSFRAEVLDMAVIDLLLGIALLLMLGFEDMFLIASIFMILVFLVCAYACFNDWSYVQEVLEDYEDAMYEDGSDDDGCECGCHDDHCDCGDRD